MVSKVKFNILDLESHNEEIWFNNFNSIAGGPVAKTLVLIAILKRQLLITAQEGHSFKQFTL